MTDQHADPAVVDAVARVLIYILSQDPLTLAAARAHFTASNGAIDSQIDALLGSAENLC